MSEDLSGQERSRRTLTDEDVKALSDELEHRLVARFYSNLGRGVWSLVWKAVVLGILALAAYGGVKGGGSP